MVYMKGGGVRSDTRHNPDLAARERCHHQFMVIRRRALAFWPIVVLFLACACGETDEAEYLSAAEIQEFIIGNSMEGSDSGYWKEQYLPFDSGKLEGEIRGRSKSDFPYRGTWSIVGDRMCVVYSAGASDEEGCFRFTRKSGNKILWFDKTGALYTEANLIAAQEVEGVVPEGIRPSFRKKVVEFQHGKNDLVADLSLPSGPSPHPVILFVHGAGPASRHFPLYQPIRNEFLRRGFATVIWSKPGVGESTGDYLTQSMGDRAAEVEAAMSHFATLPDIDGNRIGLVGGSQAGWVMPKVAAHRSVAFMIMLSCPAQDGIGQTLYLARNVLALAGLSESEQVEAFEKVNAYYELIGASASHEDFLRGYEELLADVKERAWYPKVQGNPGASGPLWFAGSEPIVFAPMGPKAFQFARDLFTNDAPPRLEDLQLPLLVIYGTEDLAVDWKLGASAYESVPRSAGNPDVTVKLFKGADHTLMQRDSEGYLEFAPRVLVTVGEWAASHR